MAHLLKKLNAKLRAAGVSEQGSVLIELAFVAPIFFGMMAGVIDISQAVRTRMKVNNLSYNIATSGSVNGRNVDEYQINDVLDNISDIIAPTTDFATQGKAIFAAIKGTSPGLGKILWNRCTGGLNDGSPYSGPDGSIVALPDNLNVGPGLTVLVSSVSYKFKPQFTGFAFPKDKVIIFTKTFVHRSRFGEYGEDPTNLKVPASTKRLCAA